MKNTSSSFKSQYKSKSLPSMVISRNVINRMIEQLNLEMKKKPAREQIYSFYSYPKSIKFRGMATDGRTIKVPICAREHYRGLLVMLLMLSWTCKEGDCTLSFSFGKEAARGGYPAAAGGQYGMIFWHYGASPWIKWKLNSVECSYTSDSDLLGLSGNPQTQTLKFYQKGESFILQRKSGSEIKEVEFKGNPPTCDKCPTKGVVLSKEELELKGPGDLKFYFGGLLSSWGRKFLELGAARPVLDELMRDSMPAASKPPSPTSQMLPYLAIPIEGIARSVNRLGKHLSESFSR